VKRDVCVCGMVAMVGLGGSTHVAFSFEGEVSVVRRHDLSVAGGGGGGVAAV
jgi:hypothetical protein